MSLCKTTSIYICIVKNSIRYSFKKFMRLHLFVCVCMCSICMSTPREVKEQLMGVILSHVRPGAGTQVVRLSSRCL